MKVSQILLTDPSHEHDPLPSVIRSAVQTVRECLPAADHVLWRRTELRNFLSVHFEPQVLQAFDRLRPYAYQSDLARYCLLYKLGGWYVDLTLQLQIALNVADSIDLIVFADRGCATCEPWAIQNGLIYAKPGLALFRRTIERICSHVEEGYLGRTPLCPTGPNLFGAELAQEREPLQIIKGDFMPVTPGRALINLMYVSQSGQLIARHRTSWLSGVEGGDLAALGVAGANNYKLLWEQRQIYAPPSFG